MVASWRKLALVFIEILEIVNVFRMAKMTFVLVFHLSFSLIVVIIMPCIQQGSVCL